MKMKTLYVTIFTLVLSLGVSQCKKKAAQISEKSKQLFGKSWVYNPEATRTTVMKKAHDSVGGAIKNLKDIKLKGDVKKMADAFTAKKLYFAADKKGRGIGFVLTRGKGILASKTDGWVKWNADETQLTLEPTDKKRKTITYIVKEISANKLVLLDVTSSTKTAEIYTR